MSPIKVKILDSSNGNISSVYNALKRSNFECEVVEKLQVINLSNNIILPGVSSFDACVKSLRKSGAFEVIKNSTEKFNKLVGLCAGAQVLFESSDEGVELGLGLLAGCVKKINIDDTHKVPHLGWNKVILNASHPMAYLFDGIDLENKKFYFSHSYRFPDSEHALAYVDYGERFPVVIAKDNLIAIQFHPEKSYHQGLQLLKNICDL